MQVFSPALPSPTCKISRHFRHVYIHDFSTNIDDGGEVSRYFFHVFGGVPLYRQNDKSLVALTAAYHLNNSQFSGGSAGSLAAFSPWDDIHSIRLSGSIQWKFDNDWELFLLPKLRSSAESGAKFKAHSLLVSKSLTTSCSMTPKESASPAKILIQRPS